MAQQSSYNDQEVTQVISSLKHTNDRTPRKPAQSSKQPPTAIQHRNPVQNLWYLSVVQIPRPLPFPPLRRGLDNLEALLHHFANVLVLVRQQAEREGDVVPLPFGFAARQPGGQLVGQLLGVLVLISPHVSTYSYSHPCARRANASLPK